ncbi:Magnesium transporter protein 1 [Melia azedarach]|uniref:Magnesium transporter protein 1 n=1 Tax=Melia azedarach TaxID=155640 RepID=A0ACC1WXK3_MELAZ|nr:Magnesium transporter protein 1 [Melia azedarach]
MAISGKMYHMIILTAISILLVSTVTAAGSNSDLVSELLSLQSQSKSGVIHLNDHLVSRFLTSTKTPRPYSLIIFFDAQQLHSKHELHLQDLHNEFSLLSSSFVANNKPSDNPSSARSKLFFCEIEFKESQSSFSLFGVNALPHIRLVGPDAKSLKDDSIPMDQGDFSRMAESMAEFVESRTKISVGPIQRPPFLSKRQIGLITVAILIWLPFMAKKIFAGETLLHDRKIWLLGAVFIYFFSVSGAMHNIIRKMPMFLADRNDPNKLVFFYQGSGMQLGAEGFAVGFLYTIVGLLLALETHVLVRVKNKTVQRLVMILSLLISFWAVNKVIYLDNWKTGYGVHAYWPSSWN